MLLVILTGMAELLAVSMQVYLRIMEKDWHSNFFYPNNTVAAIPSTFLPTHTSTETAITTLALVVYKKSNKKIDFWPNKWEYPLILINLHNIVFNYLNISSFIWLSGVIDIFTILLYS